MIRFVRDAHIRGSWLYVGPWAVRLMWPWSPGRFSNGSRWWSGWARWATCDWCGAHDFRACGHNDGPLEWDHLND